MQEITKFFHFSKNDQKILLGSFIGFILAHIGLFNIGIASDDWSYIQRFPYDNTDFFLSQERWGLACVYKIANYLQINFVSSSVFFVLLSALCLSICCLIICKTYKIEKNLIQSISISLLFLLFPYQIEILTFKVSIFIYGLALLLCFLSLYFNKNNTRNFLLSIAVFAFSLGIYQVVLGYALIFIGFLYLGQFVCNESFSCIERLKNTFTDRQLNMKTLTIILGLFIYSLVSKLLLLFNGIDKVERGNFIVFSDFQAIKNRIWQFIHSFIKSYWQEEYLFPQIYKILLIIILIIVIFQVFIYFKNITSQKKSILNTCVVICGLFLLSSVPFLIIFPIENWNAIPRVLSSISLFWVGIIALYFKLNSFRRTKKIILSTLIFILCCFSILSNRTLYEQIALTQQDREKANRILTRLEEFSGFSQVRTLAFVGNSYNYEIPIRSQTDGLMNVSAFGPSWSMVPIMSQISGYQFVAANQEQLSVATQYCQSVQPWPSIKSIKQMNNYFIICLSKNVE